MYIAQFAQRVGQEAVEPVAGRAHHPQGAFHQAKQQHHGQRDAENQCFRGVDDLPHSLSLLSGARCWLK